MPSPEYIPSGITPEAVEKSETELLDEQKAKLFEELEKTAFNLPQKEREYLVYRIMEHSIEDGFDLATEFGMGREEKTRGVERDTFISKHSGFTARLSNKLEENKDLAIGDEKVALEQFLKEIAGKLGQFNKGKLKHTDWRLNPSLSDETKKLREQIDDYYANFLKLREVREQESPEDKRSVGEKVGEANLNQAELVLEPHYYTGSVRELLLDAMVTPEEREQIKRGEKSGIDFGFEFNLRVSATDMKEHWEKITGLDAVTAEEASGTLTYSNLISRKQLEAFVAPYKIDINAPEFSKKLERARFRPLDVTFEVENKEAQKELIKEIKASMISRGFKEGDYKIQFDEAEKQYKIIETKDGKEIPVELDKNRFRKIMETPEQIILKPDDPYYEDFKRKDGRKAVFQREHEAIFKLDKKIYLLNGELYEILQNEHCTGFIVYPDGSRSKIYSWIDSLQMINGRLIYSILDRDSESFINSGVAYRKHVIDGNILGKYSPWETESDITEFKNDIYWIGCKKKKQQAEENYTKSALLKGEDVIRECEWGERISELTIIDGQLAYIVRKIKDNNWMEAEAITLVIGEETYGPFKDIDYSFDTYQKNSGNVAIGNDRNTFAIFYDKKDGTNFLCINGKEVPFSPEGKIEHNHHPLIVNEGHVYLIASRELEPRQEWRPTKKEYFIVDETGKRVSEIHDSGIGNLCIVNGKLTYSVYSRDTKRVLHYGEKEKNLYESQSGVSVVGGWENDLLYVEIGMNGVKHRLSSFDSGFVDFEGQIENVLISKDGKIFVTEKRHIDPAATGTFAPHKYVIWEYKSEIDLADEEKRKLQLVNTLELETLENIDAYFRKYYPGEVQKTFREKLKETYEHSKAFAKSLNAFIKESPKSFIDSLKSKQDDMSDYYVEQLVYSLFPSIRQSKERNRGGWFGGGTGQQKSPETIRRSALESAGSTNEFLDGDPKAGGGVEIMRFREPVSEMVMTGVYGKYHKKENYWEKSVFPVSNEHFGPTKEITAELMVKGCQSVILPKCVSGTIIPERVKAITDSGEEVSITPNMNVLGEGRVNVPKNTEKIVYSQTIQELPIVPEDISKTEYQKFRTDFERRFGIDSAERIAILPDELVSFARSIENLAPKEKVVAVERKIRELGYYDFDNKEVQEEKRDKNLNEVFSVMRARMKKIKREKPELAQELAGKQYAGVCADFAKLTTALLRQSGFVSGMVEGFRPEGDETVITTGHAHAASYALWPAESGKSKIILLDGTPDGITDEEKKIIQQIQQPSLEERENMFDAKKENINEDANKKLIELEMLVKNLDSESIRHLENGELERTLNIVLKQVRESHLSVIDRLLNASRYGGFDVSTLTDTNDINSELTYRKFLENEVKNERQTIKDNEYFKGESLLRSIEEFVSRYAKDKGVEGKNKALDIIERIFDVSKNNLDPVESRSAAAVITYLRAKRMMG